MTTFRQLNDLIEDYGSLSATIYEKYNAEDFRVEYIKNMLDTMIRCRQYLLLERQFLKQKPVIIFLGL